MRTRFMYMCMNIGYIHALLLSKIIQAANDLKYTYMYNVYSA